MATFGWVREDSLDAFLEGTSQTKDPGTPPPPSFTCPFCPVVVNTPRDLQDHISAHHSITRPSLLLRGIEPPSRLAIYSPLRAKDIALLNATGVTIAVNGSHLNQIPPKDLPEHIAKFKFDTVSMTLLNASQPNVTPVQTSYEFSFRIASASVLKGVEHAFNEHLVLSKVSRGRIDDFVSDKRCNGEGQYYAEGLAKFALGLLLKERPSHEYLTTPLSHYRDCYGSALHTLKEINRPFSKLITRLIEFAFNDPPKNDEHTGFWELDVANLLIHEPESKRLSTEPDFSRGKQQICPIDHGTDRILDFAVRMRSQTRWSPILNDECRAVAQSQVLDEMDRQKAIAIWAATAWRLGAREEAAVPLRLISATYPFKKWAEPYLEMVTK